jgi:hypothetical protein
MLPALLLQETEVRESGFGSAVDLNLAGTGEDRPAFLLLTLGVTDSIERQSLDIAIQGSEDGVTWTAKPLVAFSRKFYCGSYQLLFNLQQYPDVRYLRPQWTVSRWGAGEAKPLFGIYLSMQAKANAAMARGAA